MITITLVVGIPEEEAIALNVIPYEQLMQMIDEQSTRIEEIIQDEMVGDTVTVLQLDIENVLMDDDDHENEYQ